jgi:hypothetical protein
MPVIELRQRNTGRPGYTELSASASQHGGQQGYDDGGDAASAAAKGL